ncbi:MAG: hypothetical protein NVS9B15_00170 [Acidobacteriaceae bacterium]
MRRFGEAHTWMALVWLALTVSTTAAAQRNNRNAPPPNPAPPQQGLPQSTLPGMSPLGSTDDPMSDHTSRMQREQEKARNDDRQKKLVADTEKLLALATELKANVDKTNKDTMSVDVIRKAEEIEKLAHSVKEKMKGG